MKKITLLHFAGMALLMILSACNPHSFGKFSKPLYDHGHYQVKKHTTKPLEKTASEVLPQQEVIAANPGIEEKKAIAINRESTLKMEEKKEAERISHEPVTSKPEKKLQLKERTKKLLSKSSNTKNTFLKKTKLDTQNDGGAGSLLWLLIMIILIVWLIGLIAGGWGLGGLIHVLLVVALILFILWLLRMI
jgi:uncharacterized membrane protein